MTDNIVMVVPTNNNNSNDINNNKNNEIDNTLGVVGETPLTPITKDNIKSKKQFTPNIVKHVFKANTPTTTTTTTSSSTFTSTSTSNSFVNKNISSTSSSLLDIISPTNNHFIQKEYLNINNNNKNINNNKNNNNKRRQDNDNEEYEEEIDVHEMERHVESILMANKEHQPTLKPMFLKIKRKIGEQPLEELIIERPKKKALLDTFKDFNLNINENEDSINKDSNNNNNTNNNNNNNNIIKEKKLFTLFTSVDEANLHHNKSKLEQRFEEYKEKGHVDSPKIQRSKRDNIIKQRNENRYKQIKSNRIMFGKEQTDVIELEKSEEIDELFPSGLTKEEESLICNYRPMLKEHLQPNQINNQQHIQQQPKKVEYVYDYYYLNTDRVVDAMDISHIETIVLPPEDDYVTTLESDDSDSSTDSENWYTEYPDGDEIYSNREYDSDDPHESDHDIEDERNSDYDPEYMYEEEYSSDEFDY